MAEDDNKFQTSSKFQLGNGPNFLAGGFARKNARISLSGGVGVTGKKEIPDGTLLGSLSGLASIAGNVNGSYSPPPLSPPYSQGAMDLHEAHAVLTETRRLTGGTGDLNQLTVGQFDLLRKQHPALLKESQHQSFDEFLATANVDPAVTAQTLSTAQAQLASLGNTYPDLKTAPEYHKITQGLQTASYQISDITNQKIGEVGATVNGLDKNLSAQLDGLVNKYAPDISAEEKQQLVGGVASADKEIAKAQKYVAKIPTVNEVNSTYRKIDDILKIDPELSASLSATGAYVRKDALVFAGDVTAGAKVGVNGVVLNREDPNAKLKAHIGTTRFASLKTSMGLGTDTYTSLPNDISRKLGVSPTGGENMGGYVSAAVDYSNTQGNSVTAQTLAAGFNRSKKLSPEIFGEQTYGVINVETSCTKSPATTPKSDCKISVKSGFIF